MAAFTEADRRKILESLTADELETFKEAFTVFDKNQDGSITTKVSTLTLLCLGLLTMPIYMSEKNCKHDLFQGPFLPPTNQSRLSALNLRGQPTRFTAEIARL